MVDVFVSPFDNPVENDPCPHCGSREHHVGYGFGHGAGGLAGYVLCLGCDKMIHIDPDTDPDPPKTPVEPK